jgi:hypothetical protein
MDLYIYRTPSGNVADFRSYLDGRDHSFDDHRKLDPADPRWEKIQNLRHPETGDPIGGHLEFVGTTKSSWFELICYPIVWDKPFEPAEAAAR